MAWKTDGTVVTWGASAYGGVATPAGLGGVTAIAAGSDRTAALVFSTAPTITLQPASQTVTLNQRLTFAVTATGFPLNFQWRRDGVDVAGATGATYSFPFAQFSQAGAYTVVVSNPAGSVTSAPPAALSVSPVQANPAPPVAVLEWGDNCYGQTDVPVAAQSGVTAIAAGDGHTLALRSDGSVVAWGDNGFGQSTVPIQAQNGVTAIAAGFLHSVALKSDGSVVAWGNNEYGQTTAPVAPNRGDRHRCGKLSHRGFEERRLGRGVG